MAPWQPPIPAGALYSPPALRLGAGLALLAYCYDSVERNGWLSLNLRAAAEELGTTYSTIKDWWKLLKAGPFFSERVDRGKAGWRVRFHDDWLDWRSTALDPSRRREGGSSLLDDSGEGGSSLLEDGEGAVKEISRRREGGSSLLENLHVGTHGSRSSTSSDDDDDMRLETPRTPEGRPSSSSTQPAARAGGDEAGERTQQGADANLTERAAPSPPRSAPPPAPPALPPAIEQAFADWQGRAPESGDRKVLLSLLGDYGASWLESGIAASVAQNGKSLNYVRKMLAECRANGTQPGDPKPTTTEERNGTHNRPGPRSRGPSRRPVSPPLDEATQARYRAAPTLGELYPELRRVPRRTDRAGGSD